MYKNKNLRFFPALFLHVNDTDENDTKVLRDRDKHMDQLSVSS